MARWGHVDYRELLEFQRRLNEFEEVAKREFIESCVKELASRLLSKVIRRTPTGVYPPSTGKRGGTLKRGWASDARVKKIGNVYEIEVTNPVEYASYVEFGHRTRNHRGWVPGKFMLTISEQELESQAPQILERKLQRELERIFNGM